MTHQTRRTGPRSDRQGQPAPLGGSGPARSSGTHTASRSEPVEFIHTLGIHTHPWQDRLITHMLHPEDQ